MLDIKFIRKNPDLVARSLEKRGSDLEMENFLRLDEQRRQIIQETEQLKMERNQASARVARAKQEGQDPGRLLQGLGELSSRIKDLDSDLKKLDEQVRDWLLSVPNIVHQDVPAGRTEEDNEELKKWGQPPEFSFSPREHWEIGTDLKGLDFERAASVTGSRFVFYFGWAARMERALINFMLDVQTGEHGYIETLPPMMVNRTSMTATGQLPKFESDLFKLENWDYFLIPTAEVPLTNIHRGEILSEDELPKGFAAVTGCFRSEAGSHGKDTKGIIRQHQFNKVELVWLAHPEKSYDQLEILLSHAERILQLLGLHYRVVTLCTGDLGFGSAKTYDVEVWLPGQGKYREISSCSNFEDFQARRADIRFRPENEKKTRFVHTLNGSGLAVGRTMVAILENYQQEDGTILIPEVLRPYMGGIRSIGG
ncbi:serine--tRNA ligase [Desulfonatronovibrio hydrogenovorans]|uniref:serine--tRNA ligase n=1 Tax=Desulfonatronovibrio hydrogenovorans TaxID=53245 RepID=UPI00048BDE19|nr:serine--tRNA ligase [Desulfonatronovibrio hydrogenovorans]